MKFEDWKLIFTVLRYEMFTLSTLSRPQKGSLMQQLFSTNLKGYCAILLLLKNLPFLKNNDFLNSLKMNSNQMNTS